MDDLDAPAHNDLKHKLRHLLKLRYLMPFIYSLFCYLYWKESSSCYGRIFIINSVIVLFFCFSPTLLLQFDYLTVILFFLWVFKNDNSEAVRETDVTCLDTQNNIFFMLSLWIFKIAIWLLTTFMVIIVIFLLLSLVREFLLPPAYQGPGLSEETINNLPLVRYSEYKADPTPDEKHKKEDVCPICLEAFESEDELRMIPNCSHVYHIDCIKTWLSANTICPYCRGEIPNKEQGSILRATHRSTYTASILVHLQEMSLLSDRDAGNPTQPLLPNRR